MDDVENKFLQKVNLDLLQKETGMDMKEPASSSPGFAGLTGLLCKFMQPHYNRIPIALRW